MSGQTDRLEAIRKQVIEYLSQERTTGHHVVVPLNEAKVSWLLRVVEAADELAKAINKGSGTEVARCLDEYAEVRRG